MRRKIYYLAFLKVGNWECPQYQWYMDLVDPDRVDEYITGIQTEHMNNRLVGAWRWSIPFEITWKLGEFYQLDYSI